MGGMLPEREPQIDASSPTIADLTARMFAEPIATGEVVVTDPPEAAAAPAQAAPEPPAAPAAPATSVVTDEPLPEPEATPEHVPTFKAKLDDDLQALLDEPDFDEEARAEVAAELEDPDGEYEYTDPEQAARVRALEKRNQFLETQLVAKSKKGWIEEAKRAFPDLARLLPGEIGGIAATSRRGFLREAASINTRYATALAPTLARLEAERAAIAASAMGVARQEVADAWGRPSADSLPAAAAATQEALAKARATAQATGNIEESIKVLMNTNPVLP